MPRWSQVGLLWSTAALLHALLFVGLYQTGFTREEVHALVKPGPYKLVEPYLEAAKRHGLGGVVRVYFFGESDDRLYLEYARLTLHGEFDRAYVDKVQRNTASQAPLPERPWPYRDVRVEYPPVALLAVVPPGLFSSEYGGYRYAFAAFMLMLHLANLALAFTLLRPERSAARSGEVWLLLGSLMFCALLGRIVATRMDHLVVTWTLLCLWAGVRADTRPGWAAVAGVFAGLGVMTKLVPGLALLALVILWWRAGRLKLAIAACAAAAVTLLGVNGAMFAFAGERYLETFRYHTLRGVQIESLYANLLLLARGFGLSLSVSESFGSTNLESSLTRAVQLASPWLLLASCAVIGLRRWSFGSLQAVMLTSAFLIAYILTGRVFSPQYLIWIAAPLLAAAAWDPPGGVWRKLFGLFLAIAAVSQLIYPQGYPVLKAFHPLALGLLSLRNVALVALLVLIVRHASAPHQRKT